MNPTDEKLSYLILKCAYKVHSALGSGLLESVYKTCLAHELRKENLKVEVELGLPLVYDGLVFDKGFRIDILVENRFIVELKVVEKISVNHVAQTLSYMRLAKVRNGLILNFMEKSLKDGIKSLII